MKNPEQAPANIVKEIRSIYARWRAGEISQEDALFEIGDSLTDPLSDDIGAVASED